MKDKRGYAVASCEVSLEAPPRRAEGKGVKRSRLCLHSSQSHLPPKQMKQEDVERHLLVFYAYGANPFAGMGMIDKRGYAVASCEVSLEAPPRRAEGKGVKRSRLCLRSSQSHLPPKQTKLSTLPQIIKFGGNVSHIVFF